MYDELLKRVYDDGQVRNIHEWHSPSSDETIVRMDLHIRHSDLRRAQAGGIAHLVDAVNGSLSPVVSRHMAKAAYGLRPRPRLGAGTLGYARRKR